MNLPANIHGWLNKRGISDAVLEHNNIQFENNMIVIPVYNKQKEFLFNKYRRSPFSEEGPKYTYDKGAAGALYNTNNLWFPTGSVVLVEGELDAMRLQSAGYLACSTTGGSGTFKKEWAELLAGYDIYICYDNDDAGQTGAVRVLEVFPHARVIEIPRAAGVKDITDYLSKNPPESFIERFNEAKTWRIPQEPEGTTKPELKRYLDELMESAVNLSAEIRARVPEDRGTEFPERLLQLIQLRHDKVKHEFNHKRGPVNADPDALRRAKAVPITEFFKVNNQGYALCINHAEKTASMKYYKSNNKVKCFGCGFAGDTIDVVMKMNNCTVGEAIKKING